MEWVASTLHTTSELCVSSITTADAHTSAVSSRLKWLPCRFKWTRPFRRKTKSGFCACAITFQTQPNSFYSCAELNGCNMFFTTKYTADYNISYWAINVTCTRGLENRCYVYITSAATCFRPRWSNTTAHTIWQNFFTTVLYNCVRRDDGPARLETCSSWRDVT